MKRNFKRINNSGDSVSVAYEKYEELKAEFDSIKDSCLETEIEPQECKAQIEDCAAEISALEKAYSNSGGISEEEWNNVTLEVSASYLPQVYYYSETEMPGCWHYDANGDREIW